MRNFKGFMNKIILIFTMVLIFGGLGYSNVYAATVGQSLVQPEAGWKRVQESDLNITYTGKWILDNNSNIYSDGTPAYSDGKGKYCTSDANTSIKFNIISNKIRIVGLLRQSGYSSNTIIKIDGIEEKYTEITSSPYINAAILYERTNIDYKEHFVEIRGELGKYTTLDAIDIDSSGIIKPYSENITTNVSNISLDKSTDNLQVGQTDQLTATIKPDNATNKNVKWKSSDESIATVDKNGKVTAIKEGTATITATTTDGSNLSALCVVTVISKGTTPTNPTDNTGNAILTITMTNGNVKSYTVPMSKVNDFISWYDNRVSGSTGKAYYTFDKTDNLQPFSKKTEYIIFDKISSYEVDEYTK
ncbi:Ig-like domain-containing protein [Clostridium drakei]|uniref:BIG2 domain-containing protein n=1 Tax=Clostridium drakei TaxID=332101 RepID=A0A2U8DUY7_9CLOT|nr:Ig-like domain-containing protein [Clostridium drakei]AWI06563.1 hypothetical protein B9W14_19370 [Clostridium drakei]